VSDPHFLIVSAGWKCWPWIQQTVESIDAQEYRNFSVVLADDHSEDAELALYMTQTAMDRRGWACLVQQEHKGTLRNQVEAIRLMKPDPEDVIVFLDADGDHFAHEHVLDRLVEAYADGSKVVYSMYEPYPPSPGSQQSRPHPPEVIRSNNYRAFTARAGHHWNHIRSFKAELFYGMDDSDFTDDDGNWFMGAPDSALMFPALELARGKVKFFPEVLMRYRADHSQSDWVLHAREIDRAHDIILSRPPKVVW
jgi:glycosyltransferase involved in cell wall biosynthesis